RRALSSASETADRSVLSRPHTPISHTMNDLLRLLTSLPGPTGQEHVVIDWLEDAWSPRGETVRTPVGNLLLRIPGPGPRIILAAHADELSMIVRSITPEGFLRVIPGEKDHFANPA